MANSASCSRAARLRCVRKFYLHCTDYAQLAHELPAGMRACQFKEDCGCKSCTKRGKALNTEQGKFVGKNKHINKVTQQDEQRRGEAAEESNVLLLITGLVS